MERYINSNQGLYIRLRFAQRLFFSRLFTKDLEELVSGLMKDSVDVIMDNIENQG